MINRACLVFAALALLWVGQAGAATTYANTSVPFAWIDASGHTKLGPVTGGLYSPTYKFQNATGGCGTVPPIIDDTITDKNYYGCEAPAQNLGATSEV